MWLQKQIILSTKPRGFHLITTEVIRLLPELAQCKVGLLHLWLQHTSASLTINENTDADVRLDFEQVFNRLIPEQRPNQPLIYRHHDEGSDDLPAHIKSSLLGCQLTIPLQHGQLGMGMWQGIYLGEHRNRAGGRQLLATISGADY